VRTLRDRGQTALEIAHEAAAFLAAAERTLDLALYDLRVDGPEELPIVRALLDAHARGVRVRIAYNVDHPGPIPVPPPPESVPDTIEALPVETAPIPGVPDLMHHKYAIRDAEAVLTGSANWTEDSWSRQENVIASVSSVEVAQAYTADFEQLWERRDVAASGRVSPAPIEVGGATVRTWFTPGHGEDLSQRIASRIGHARRIRICSPVITAGPILGTLAQVVSDRRADVAGCVDATQVADVIRQWYANGNAAWKIPLLRCVLEKGGFTGKRSTPWRPGSLHDFMHAKVTVCDDTVFLGSFNLSRSGELNAENVLEIREPGLADRLAAFVDSVRAIYPAVQIA
jgi:phosphatidylserine/phosphatidylglycerophosphate/cardiolipin synthase-like enzyme